MTFPFSGNIMNLMKKPAQFIFFMYREQFMKAEGIAKVGAQIL